MPFDTIEAALQDIRAGKMVIVADDEDRENEGDLVCAASAVTPEIINFMATYGRGLICLALTAERADELELKQMSENNTEALQTAFTVSIDAAQKFGVTTGISASDRAKTIQVAMDPATRPSDLRRPGHIFPLRARAGGVLRRVGQTEASVDLARLAGLPPAGVICEILNEDGTMARRPQLEEFAARFDLKFITVAQIVAYRLKRERLVRREAEAVIPTPMGDWRIIAYRNDVDQFEHVAMVKGEVEGVENVMVRMHSECLTGDVFHSLRCDCGEQLDCAMRQIDKEGRGAIVYLRQEGRGIGLVQKLRAYNLQDQGMDTVEANEALGFRADLREYGIGAQILLDLGLSSVRILTNNPKKIVGMDGYGLSVVEQIPLTVEPNEYNSGYLRTKRDRMGHMLALEGDAA
ncbi:MAG TPA: bifunctional 3,4-dihydroxy-2-butanone-4-phosphate synthase/GTP cyclohydrolase II [Longimicrobium sp.]|uniref:bifunctional 3,4-dihydroxy-2-butanone-4-phosphate synthase/GTP cyclohydrolase II n=1 Tax=Longimicrobium sp. TaxID=2029185 RepID=UPI002ED79508